MDCVDLLQQLVSIPSVNPMGATVGDNEPFESNLTAWLTAYFGQLGVAFECLEVAHKRANVIARYEAPNSPVTVLLDAHQDTVPVEGMTIEPFTPTLTDGRLYGRGSCDVKGGMAAMLWAFTQLVHQRPPDS
ncbi:MAG: M20/M25/M40 family metallo-hydrolase, partial [Planctomycetaceae bacterium]